MSVQWKDETLIIDHDDSIKTWMNYAKFSSWAIAIPDEQLPRNAEFLVRCRATGSNACINILFRCNGKEDRGVVTCDGLNIFGGDQLFVGTGKEPESLIESTR